MLRELCDVLGGRRFGVEAVRGKVQASHGKVLHGERRQHFVCVQTFAFGIFTLRAFGRRIHRRDRRAPWKLVEEFKAVDDLVKCQRGRREIAFRGILPNEKVLHQGGKQLERSKLDRLDPNDFHRAKQKLQRLELRW